MKNTIIKAVAISCGMLIFNTTAYSQVVDDASIDQMVQYGTSRNKWIDDDRFTILKYQVICFMPYKASNQVNY